MNNSADNHSIHYQIGQASSLDILNHLRQCSSQFRPPLEQRVDLSAYAEKLFSRSVTMEAWCQKQLIGLVATYFNANSESPTAFISSVSVLAEFRSQGIAKRLLRGCHDAARRLGTPTIYLQVSSGNKEAKALYLSLGYIITATEDDHLTMQLDLDPDR